MSFVTRNICVLAATLTAWLLAALLAAAPGLAANATPGVFTGGASLITTSSATLSGSVYPNNQQATYFFEYGETAAYGARTAVAVAGSGKQTIRVSAPVIGLTPFTTYHYRIVATNASGTATGQDNSFVTKKIPLTFSVTRSIHVVYGSPFTVTGTLAGTGSANHQLVLQATPFPFLFGFKNIGVPLFTDATGRFSFPVSPLKTNTQLRLATLETPPVHSGVMIVLVAARVSLHVGHTARRGWVRFYGTVSPAEPGSPVRIQLARAGHPLVTLAATTLKSGGSQSRFSIVVHVRHKGLYRARVKVLSGAQVSNSSRPLLIR